MAQPGYEGFAALGDIVVGGPQRKAQGNYNTYLKQSADGQSAMEKAAIVRAQRIARDNLPAAIAADPALAAHGGLATSVLGMATGQPNLGSYTKGLGDLADQEMDRQALEALQAGDIRKAQQLSAVKTDKILPTLEAGGKAVFTPVTGDVAMTPLGDAAVSATGALEDAREASAAKSRRPAPIRAGGGGHASGAPSATIQKMQVAAMERDLGRPLTAKELGDLANGTLNIQVPADRLGDEPATAIHPHIPATRAFSQGEVQQAIDDARRAIGTGKITKQQAQQRLREAGLDHAAGVL